MASQNTNQVDILKDIVKNINVPTTTLRGGQLILSADLARMNAVKIDGKIIHGENAAKVHPNLANMYKALAVALCASPRSDRGATLLDWVRNAESELKKIGDKVLEVELQGVSVKAKIKDLVEYAKASKSIEILYSGAPRVRKKSEVGDEEWEFI